MLSDDLKLMIETKLEEVIDSIMKPYCCEKQKHRIKKDYKIDLDSNDDIVIDILKDPKLKYHNLDLYTDNVLNSVFIAFVYDEENCYIAFDYTDGRKVFDIFRTNVHCHALEHFARYKFYEIFQKYGVNNHYVIKFK